jgi:hypothetical protein
MNPQIAHAHHYVPQWYQKRFFAPGQTVLHYLDLKPEIFVHGDKRYTKKNPKRCSPSRCFCDEDLYLLRFGKEITDAVEKKFFGAVDDHGARAGAFFDTYAAWDDEMMKAYKGLLLYIGAQRFRTPRGLDWIEKRFPVHNHNETLMAMRQVFDQYRAMWMEGVWEIVHAKTSPVKFIISDDPVTFFNRRIYPGEDPAADDFPKIGTRTIFPLSAQSCLIITHLQLVRNPRNDPLQVRENARLFGTTVAKVTDIQFGRELDEGEVLRLNYIMKSRATKFIAAGREEFLYPEKQLGKLDWAKLDDDWFLLPNPWKVAFTTGIMLGGGRMGPFSMDEYGRKPGHPRFEDRKRRDSEHRTFDAGKREWAKRRVGHPLAQIIDEMRENTVADRMVREYLQEEGLVVRDEPAPEP